VQFAVGIVACHLFVTRKNLPKPLNSWFGVVCFLLVTFCGRILKSTEAIALLGSWGNIAASMSNLLLTAGFGALLFHVITEQSWLQAILESPTLRFLGKISYSIYLWHSFFIFFLSGTLSKLNLGVWNTAVGFLLVVLVCVPASYVSYRLLEAFYFKRQRLSPDATNTSPV
jgi:peptidoglycan/LPS O-acetylase OafA/YrhL